MFKEEAVGRLPMSEESLQPTRLPLPEKLSCGPSQNFAGNGHALGE
jgi:hypothetical protein